MSTFKLPVAHTPVDRATAIPVSVTSRQASTEHRLQGRPSSKDRLQNQARQTKPQSAREPPEYQRLVEQMNQMVRMLNRDYEFSIDQETNQFVVRVTNSETGELLHQMPPEELLDLASRMDEMMGVFLNELA